MREIETLAALDAALDAGTPLRGLRLQDLDLTGRTARLLGRDDVEGLVVLGGRLPDDLEHHLREHGALVFPTDPRAPVDPYRATLYTPDELYDGLREVGYAATPDARAYRWSRDAAVGHDAFVTLLRAIHDDSMSDALTDALARRSRSSASWAATRWSAPTPVSHGRPPSGTPWPGPGTSSPPAGARGRWRPPTSAPWPPRARPWRTPSPAWPPSRPSGRTCGDGRSWPSTSATTSSPGAREGVRSIGIPTWFYGHEPPNVFCDGIAKYFSNAIREDGLLARSTAGVVVLEGAAGTVQEVFQAATRLYYEAEPSDGRRCPGSCSSVARHWSETVPVWPALERPRRRAPDGRAGPPRRRPRRGGRPCSPPARAGAATGLRRPSPASP